MNIAEAMLEHGITPPPQPIIYDGRIQRFKNEGDDKNNSWYVAFKNSDYESGAFGCWKLGVDETFCSRDLKTFTEEEKQSYAIQQSLLRKQREKDTKVKHQVAETNVNDRWTQAEQVDSHQYLADKGVRSYDLRVDRGALLVPLFNIDGEMVNIQSINPNGDKYFTKGGQKKGCFYLLGDVTDTLILCEGYSTGASIYEATKIAVAICFDAGNLMPVALELSTKHPNAKILIAGDDDRHNEVNTGRINACETATHVGGSVVFPVFDEHEKDNPTDFNDLHRLTDLKEVKKQIWKAIHDSMGVKRKESVLLYESFYLAMKECEDDIQIKVFHAVMEYGLYGKNTQLTGIAKSLFVIMKPLIDENVKNYNNAKKGGRKSKKDKSLTSG